jgi:cardiolipin synthase
MQWVNAIYSIVVTVYMVTIISLVILVVSENRNPIKTMSWVLVLTFVPFFGLIIYYIFGEDNRKKRFISKRMYKRLKNRALSKNISEELTPLPEQYRELATLLKNLDQSPVLEGNEVRFFTDTREKFTRLFEDIRSAQHHVHIQYYIYEDGEIGTQLGDLLIQKAKEGVEVRLMYDDVGSWKSKNSFFRKMKEAGVLVEPFLPVVFPILTSRVNYRNHRKIVVIDGEIGYIGGMNVADRYLNGGKFGYWCDLHLRMRGKGVQGLQSSFLLDWYYAHKTYITSRAYFPPLPVYGNNPLQIVTSGPIGMYRTIAQGLFYAFANAKKTIYIQTPYFIPSDSILNALQTAAMSGIDVRIVIPQKDDSVLVHHASKSFVKELLYYRVKVYLYHRGFIHSKLVVIDDSLTIVGSSNMDVRSFEHNFEVNAFIYDEVTAFQATQIFLKDLQYASLIVPEEWDKRSRSQRFKESACRLLAPLL